MSSSIAAGKVTAKQKIKSREQKVLVLFFINSPCSCASYDTNLQGVFLLFLYRTFLKPYFFWGLRLRRQAIRGSAFRLHCLHYAYATSCFGESLKTCLSSFFNAPYVPTTASPPLLSLAHFHHKTLRVARNIF